MHGADYSVARCLSVRLSGRPSVTRRYSVNTTEHILTFLPLGSAAILVFPWKTGWQYSDGNPVKGRAGKNLGFLEFFKGFLGFLGFNVHNAEHRYMTHDK